MSTIPKFSTDTVVYGQKSIYANENLDFNILDQAELNFWGIVRVNGQLINPTVGFITPSMTFAQIQAVIDAVAVGGGGEVLAGYGTYTLTDKITLKNNVHLVGNGATIVTNTTANAIEAAGVYSADVAFTVDHAAGVTVLTLPVGQGANFAVDDVICVKSEQTVITGIPVAKARELHRIISVSGDQVTLHSITRYRYNVADNAEFFKITPVKNISVKGFTLKYGASIGRGIVFIGVIDGDIDVRVENGPSITLSDTILCRIKAVVDGNKQYLNVPFGYGTVVGGSGYLNRVEVQGRACRHVFTTLPTELDGFTYTGPFGTVVSGGGEAAPESFAVWDTHYPAIDTMFVGITGRGSNATSIPLLQDRGFRTRVSNFSFFGGNRGVTLVADNSKFAVVENGSIELAPSSALSCVAVAGEDCTVRNTLCISASGYGIESAGARALVEDNRLDCLVNLRETNLTDVGSVFPRNTLYISSAYAILDAKGRYIANTYVQKAGSTVFANPTSSARVEDDWHAPSVVAYAAAITPTPIFKNNIQITLTGPLTVNNPGASDKIKGAKIRVATIQDATGGRVTTYGSDFKRNNVAHVTTANKINIDEFEFNGTNWLQTSCSAGL